jgi:2-oxoglutarate dehydrogenase E2 component (dihydrolipoamide succinyltransferase)
MPRVDANVDEGTVGTWFLEEGEEVGEGQRVAEIITDKATFEIESEIDGYFRRKTAPEKSVLPVGYVLALITEAPDEPLPDVSDENRQIMTEYREQMLFGGGEESGRLSESDTGTEDGKNPESDGKLEATPSARRLAREHGVDLQAVASVRDGVIRAEDVESFVESE